MDIGTEDDDYEAVLIKEMLQALELLDPELRHEYDEAIEMAPELVLTETKFMDFLRTDAFDATKAATRFVRYWKYRKRLFGADRWLLPLDQTGRGALSAFDIQVLQSGHVVVVSRPNAGPVLLYDLSLLPCTAGWASTRVNFYMAKVFAQEFSSFHGMTLIHVVTSAKRHALSLDKEIITYCTTGLPVRVTRLIVAQSYEEGKELLIDLLAEHQARVTEHQSGAPPPRIKGDSVKQTLDLLETRMGLDRQFVPLSLGGSLPHDFFANWMRQRLTVEDPLSAAPVMSNVLPPPAAAVGGQDAVVLDDGRRRRLQPQQQQQQQSPPLVSQTASKERALVATVSPKKTAQQHQLPQKQQDSFQIAHKGRPPASSSSSSSKLYTGQRQRNTIHSLREQQKSLELCNAALRKDNRRLEGLLGQARYVGAVSEQARTIVMQALGNTGATTKQASKVS